MYMSFASTQALINLWETDVVSPQSFNQVYQQTRHLQEDEDIAEAIEAWLDSQHNSQLLEAYKNQLRELTASISLESEKKLGMGNSKSPTPAGKPNPTFFKPRLIV